MVDSKDPSVSDGNKTQKLLTKWKTRMAGDAVSQPDDSNYGIDDSNYGSEQMLLQT